MNPEFENFYTCFFEKTGGFIPTLPFPMNLYPGDIIRFTNGQIIILGNVWQLNIFKNEFSIGYNVPLDPPRWDINDGCNHSYQKNAEKNAIEGEFTSETQTLKFEKSGSFLFRGEEPRKMKLLNWNEVSRHILSILVKQKKPFDGIYFVTESASASQTMLMIAESENAEIELTRQDEFDGSTNLYESGSVRPTRSSGIHYFHSEMRQPLSFFKAKKLVRQGSKKENFAGKTTQSLISSAIKKFYASTKLKESIIYELEYPNGASNGYVNVVNGAKTIEELIGPYSGNLSNKTRFEDRMLVFEGLPGDIVSRPFLPDHFMWADLTLDDMSRLFYKLKGRSK